MSFKEKFEPGTMVQHVNGGPEMMVVKYMVDTEWKGQLTPPLNAKRIPYVKVVWLEGLKQQAAVYHQDELKPVKPSS